MLMCMVIPGVTSGKMNLSPHSKMCIFSVACPQWYSFLNRDPQVPYNQVPIFTGKL